MEHIVILVVMTGQFIIIATILNRIAKEIQHMATALEDLTAQVTQNTSVENSAITLLQNLAAQLAAAGTDPVKLSEITNTLKTSADALAAAITANTPAAPTA